MAKKNKEIITEEVVELTEEQKLRALAMEEQQTTFNEDFEGLFEDATVENENREEE